MLAAAVLGLFAGAAVWVIGLVQAERRPSFGPGTRASWMALLPVLIQMALVRQPTSAPPAAEHRGVRLLFELAVAAYAGVAAHNFGASLDFVASFIFALPLLTILLVDWWTRYIHTSVVAAGVLAGLAFALARGLPALANSVLAALAASAIFGLGYLLAGILFGQGDDDETPFGLGDVYLAGMIGAMAGFPRVVPALFGGVFLAAVVGLLLLLTRRRDRTDTIAYGPYLCLGALFV
nr:prepilin peptidase [Chloroflexia bacterium]